MPVQERTHLQSELSMPSLSLPDPPGYIGRKLETLMVCSRDLPDNAVDSSDFNSGANPFRALREQR